MSVRAAGAGDGGAEGELLEEELTQVDRVLEEALKAVQRKSHLVFNLTSKEWLKHFDRSEKSMPAVALFVIFSSLSILCPLIQFDLIAQLWLVYTDGILDF